jgi:hypothetical protein
VALRDLQQLALAAWALQGYSRRKLTDRVKKTKNKEDAKAAQAASV